MFLDRILNGRVLPNNCIVMAGGNEADTGTMVFELDNATRTRFISVKIIADFDSWVQDFAPAASITPTVISYLKQNMERFCETERALSQNRTLYGNPRAWEHVSKAERSIMRKPEDRKSEDLQNALYDMVAGKVGTELAAEYIGVFKNVAEMSNLYDLLKATPAERKGMWPKSIGQLYALTYSMMSWPTTIEQGKQVVALAAEMPKSESNLPFQEMRAPLVEIIIKRLKALGHKATEVSKAFKAEADEQAEDLFKNGPLLKL